MPCRRDRRTFAGQASHVRNARSSPETCASRTADALLAEPGDTWLLDQCGTLGHDREDVLRDRTGTSSGRTNAVASFVHETVDAVTPFRLLRMSQTATKAKLYDLGWRGATQRQSQTSRQISRSRFPRCRAAAHRGHPVGLRRTDREQPAAHPDSGGDGPRPLPRVVRPFRFPGHEAQPHVASPLGEIPQRLGGDTTRSLEVAFATAESEASQQSTRDRNRSACSRTCRVALDKRPEPIGMVRVRLQGRPDMASPGPAHVHASVMLGRVHVYPSGHCAFRAHEALTLYAASHLAASHHRSAEFSSAERQPLHGSPRRCTQRIRAARTTSSSYFRPSPLHRLFEATRHAQMPAADARSLQTPSPKSPPHPRSCCCRVCSPARSEVEAA